MRVVLVSLLLLSTVSAQDATPASVRDAYAGTPPQNVLTSDAGTLRWEALLGDPRMKQGNYLSALAFAPDGGWIAAADWAGRIKLWEAKTGRLVRAIDAHGGIARELAISDNGKWIASAGPDEFRVWEADTGTLVVEQKIRGVRSLDFQASTSQLLYAAGTTVRVWDVNKRTVMHTLESDAAVERALFTPDGTRVLTVSGDTSIRVWDLETGHTIRTIEAPRDVTALAVTPDNKSIVAMCMSKYVRWDLNSGLRESSAEGPRVMASAVAISPDGASAAAGGLDSELVVIRMNDGKLLWRNKEHKGPVNSVRYSPNGAILATGSMDGTVRLWEAETGKPIRPPVGHINDVRAVVFHPGGKRVATGSLDGSLCIWDAAKLRMLHHVRAHKFPLRGIACLPAGFLTVGHDWVPALWNLDGKRLRTFKGEFAGGIFAVAADPRGAWFVTGHENGLCRKWNARTGAVPVQTATHPAQVESMAIARDGSWVVSGDFKGRVFVHATSGLDHARELKGHTGKVGAIDVHPTAALLATASDDGTVRVWNAVTGETVHVLNHRAAVEAVAFSEDGRWIYGGRWDGLLAVWSVKPFGYVDGIQVDGGPLCIAARGDQVWVGCRNGTVCVYRHTPN